MSDKIRKSDAEWNDQLTPEQFEVCRRQATEGPFTGEYDSCKEEGVYHCVCCGNGLFSSEAKYDSGTGWPSFFQPIDDSAVDARTDASQGMARTEVICSRCDAHLGHVFPDGPRPTGQRYCMNSLALKLEKKDPPE